MMLKLGLILLIIATFAASGVHSDWFKTKTKGCKGVEKKIERLNMHEFRDPNNKCTFECYMKDKLRFTADNYKKFYADGDGSYVLCCCDSPTDDQQWDAKVRNASRLKVL